MLSKQGGALTQNLICSEMTVVLAGRGEQRESVRAMPMGAVG